MSEEAHGRAAAPILAYLRICTMPATTREIAQSVRKAHRNVAGVLKTLEKRGVVRRTWLWSGWNLWEIKP